MLTRKQYELLIYIDDYLQREGVSPSFEEMKEALNLKSKSGIHRLITALEERGFIARLPHRARALEVLKRPENRSDDAAPARAPVVGSSSEDDALPPNVIRGAFAHEDEAPAAAAGGGTEVPLYGRIAAGLPIEAVRDTTTMDVPAGLMASGGEHYALEVAGDSMIDAGILDGDIVLIRKSDTAQNGEIVVALVEDHEVTLKRLRRRGDSIALEPANPAHETRIFGPDQVKVQGSLVALIRTY